MVTNKIKQVLTDAGCTLVIYEQQQLINLYTDQSRPVDIIGHIIRPVAVNLEVKANAIHEHYNPLTIEILQQVSLEDKAENNEVQLQTLLNICKQVVIRLIAMAEFKTILPVTALRVLENKYDANVIGWAINLNLYYLLNETRDPCLT